MPLTTEPPDTQENNRAIERTTAPKWRLDDRTVSLVSMSALLFLAVLALLVACYFARALIFPIVLALIMNLVLSPVVEFLHRLHLPYSLGAAMVVLGILLVTALGIGTLVTPASHWMKRAPANLREAETKLRSLRRPVEQISAASEQVDKMTDMSRDDEVVRVALEQPSFSATVLNGTGNVMASVFLTVVMLYFLLAAGHGHLSMLVELMPTWAQKRGVVTLAREIQQGISTYLFTTTLINACLGAAIGLAMWLLGLPNAILWGVMAMLLNFVPYLGAAVGSGVVFFVAVLTFDDPMYALLAPAIYMGINSIEGNFVTPMLLGRTVRLSPVAIVAFLVTWSWLWGIGGAIIAVPLLATVKIFCDGVPALAPVGRLLGGPSAAPRAAET